MRFTNNSEHDCKRQRSMELCDLRTTLLHTAADLDWRPTFNVGGEVQRRHMFN